MLFLLHSWLIALGGRPGLFGTVGPIFYLKFKAGARAKALSRQLPDALEVMVRSLEAGHPVPTAISLVGREMPDPDRLGVRHGRRRDRLSARRWSRPSRHIADRCRHPDIDLFAATIRLQERSGGNLTGLLKMTPTPCASGTRCG